MGRQSALRRHVSEYLESCHGVYSDATLRTYGTELRAVVRTAESMWLPVRVSQWSEPEILALRAEWEPKYSSKSLQLRFAVLGRFLIYCGNHVIQEMRARNRLRLPKAERGQVRWHSSSDRAHLMAHANATDRMILVLGYLLGLRRSEMVNLRLRDISSSELRVYGKGKKVRMQPLDPMVKRELDTYIHGYRADTVTAARKAGHQGAEPNTLLIWRKGHLLGSYSPNSLYDRLVRLGARAGVPITTHDLRRTFGRALYEHGTDLVVIQKALGHSNLATTIEYLGIGQEDLRAAFQGIATTFCTETGIASYPSQ